LPPVNQPRQSRHPRPALLKSMELYPRIRARLAELEMPVYDQVRA
jgi:hypothetical protein